MQCLLNGSLLTVPEGEAGVEQLSLGHLVQLQVWLVGDQIIDHRLQLAHARAAQVVGGFEVIVENCFPERLKELVVLVCAADEGLLLASEVLELVLYFLQLQIYPLDNLDLDEFFEVVIVAGADEKD